MGVPEEVLRRRAKRGKGTQTGSAAVTAPKAQEQPEPQEQDAAADNPTEEEGSETAPRFNWDEVVADPECNRQIQAIVQSRLRGAKDAEANLGKLTPALELLARRHGLDAANIDYDALAKAIGDDDSYYEDKALEMGVSIETARQIDQEERATARQQRQEAATLEQQKFQNHIAKLEQQGAELKKVFPNFDLRTELQNPAFARMTAPGVGISVEDAYYAVHRKEIQLASMQVAAQKTAQKISNDIRAGNRRPAEHGTSGQAPSVTTFDYRSLSPEERKAFKARIRSGEKIYPGQL